MVQVVDWLHGSGRMRVPIHRRGDAYSIHAPIMGQIVVLHDKQEKNKVQKARQDKSGKVRARSLYNVRPAGCLSWDSSGLASLKSFFGVKTPGFSVIR